MATRAQISRFSGPTQIETVYNHYDGYPEYLGKALKDHHYDQDSVMDIMDGGNVRAIDSETGEVEHYENEPSRFINGDSMATVIGNYAEHINNEGGAYAYIWDGEDFHTIKNNGIGGMIDQLTKIFIDKDMNENKEFDLKEYLADNRLLKEDYTQKKYTEEEWKRELDLNIEMAKELLAYQRSTPANRNWEDLTYDLIQLQKKSSIPGNIGFFKEWIESQETNELPNSSSGSFFTGLTDVDGLLSAMNFENEDENGEELYTDEEYTAAQKYHTDKINTEVSGWSKY